MQPAVATACAGARSGTCRAFRDGGAGGAGTAGKGVTLSIPAQTFAGDPCGDVVSLARHAVGGSGWTGTWTTTSSGPSPFTTIYDQQGTPGGLAQSGANGARRRDSDGDP